MLKLTKIILISKILGLGAFSSTLLWIIKQVYSEQLVIQIPGVKIHYVIPLIILVLVIILIIGIYGPKILLEKVKVASNMLLFLQNLISIILTIWLIYWVGWIYNGIMYQTNNFGEIVKTSWLEVKRSFSIEEKLMWVAELKEKLKTQFSWETLDMKKIDCKNDLLSLVETQLNTQKNGLISFNEKLTQELMNITYSPIKGFIYDYRYLILGVIGVGIGIIYKNEISNAIMNIFDWLTNTNNSSIGELLSEGYKTSYNLAIAGIKATQASTSIFNYNEKVKDLVVMLANETGYVTKKQDVFFPMVENLFKEISRLPVHTANQQAQVDALTACVREMVNFMSNLPV